jgi:hypothetical protein
LNAAPSCSSAECCAGRHHRRSTGVDGVDDFAWVDPLQVGPGPRGAMRKERTDKSISSVLAGMPALG